MDYHFDRIHQWVPEQMFISALSMSSSVLNRDKPDRSSFIDLRLVDKPGPPTTHRVRPEVVGPGKAAIVLEKRRGIWEGSEDKLELNRIFFIKSISYFLSYFYLSVYMMNNLLPNIWRNCRHIYESIKIYNIMVHPPNNDNFSLY